MIRAIIDHEILLLGNSMLVLRNYFLSGIFDILTDVLALISSVLVGVIKHFHLMKNVAKVKGVVISVVDRRIVFVDIFFFTNLELGV